MGSTATGNTKAQSRDNHDHFLTPEEVLCGGQSLSAALDTIGGTWAMATLTGLRSGPLRYSELRRCVVGISDRMLSQTLKAFERDGIVDRRVLRTIPSHVEYELTDLGNEVIGALNEFLLAVTRLAPEVAAARQRHEESHPA